MSLAAWPRGLVVAVPPTPLPEATLAAFSPGAAALIGWPAAAPTGPRLEALAGNAPLEAFTAYATVYGGHQFGVWAGRLGDGRALCIGEAGGHEIQLKGAGQTPFSRGADGRAVLRSSVREFLASEAMAALGIPTTRALSLVASSLPVRRERVETAAVVARLAPSFARFGHFEWLAATGQSALMAPLADALIDAHFPNLTGAPDRYARWLETVVVRTAVLMAQWQSVGFCHGVMNTDNFSLLGLTLDYGPFGFLDGFDAHHICNHSDEGGRYAYDRQPQIGHWNCAQLLNACLPLLGPDDTAATERATAILDLYPPRYAEAALGLWRRKLGLATAREDDADLINRWLTLLHRTRADFTGSFRRLGSVESASAQPDAGRDFVADPVGYDDWIGRYRWRLQAEDTVDAERRARMEAVNPRYVLRNHLAQTAINLAERGDFSELHRLQRVLEQPFSEQPGREAYAEPPPAEMEAVAVSCSS